MYVAESKRLTHQGAKRMMNAAVEMAGQAGIAISCAIVDAGGHLILLERMDGGRFHTVHSCTTKAVCAASNRRPTTAKGAAGQDLDVSHAIGLALAAGPERWTAMEGGYPPFSEAGPDGKLKGFDIDIANALCAELKAQCTQVPMDFDGMIPSLNARKVDMIIASMSITEERKRAVAFSDRYYITPSQIVARKGLNLTVTPEGMKGKKIAVQRSTIHDRFATDYFKQSQIVRYTKQDDVFLDLAAGRIECGHAGRRRSALPERVKTAPPQALPFVGHVIGSA